MGIPCLQNLAAFQDSSFQQGGASGWVAVALLLFQPFPFAGELNPSTSIDFLSYLLGLPPAGTGQARLLPPCCQPGQAPKNRQNHCSLLTAGCCLPHILMVLV